jgi:hypothetical protein
MIQLRFILKNGKKILQFRCIPLQIGESSCGDLVLEPQPPVSMKMEKNWTDWEDVPLVVEDPE